MRETTPAAMPPCFDKWCKRFDDLLRTKAQKKGFRHYLGGLLGESERKNIYQMASDSVGVTYHKLHHFLTEATWSADKINERRLEVMNKCSQTRISRGFSLIIDDSGHRKSVSWCACVLWGFPRVVRCFRFECGVIIFTRIARNLYDLSLLSRGGECHFLGRIEQK